MIFLQAAQGLAIFVILIMILILAIGGPVLAIIIRNIWRKREIKKNRCEGLQIGYSRNDDWGDIISSYLISIILLTVVFFLSIIFFFKDVEL